MLSNSELFYQLEYFRSFSKSDRAHSHGSYHTLLNNSWMLVELGEEIFCVPLDTSKQSRNISTSEKPSPTKDITQSLFYILHPGNSFILPCEPHCT